MQRGQNFSKVSSKIILHSEFSGELTFEKLYQPSQQPHHAARHSFWQSGSIGVCVRESMCVTECVCVREREGVCVCVSLVVAFWLHWCVCVREYVCERECVCVRERECVFLCHWLWQSGSIGVCVREAER